MRPTAEQKTEEFWVRANLDRIIEMVIRVDADISNNPPLMNDVIEQAFLPTTWSRVGKKEDILSALYQNFLINEIPAWIRDGGIMDQNSGLFIDEALKCFRDFIDEIDNPGYGLRYSLAVCDHVMERLEREAQITHELITDFEQAQDGIAQDRQQKAQEIADFRRMSWFKRRRKRGQLPILISEYANILRKSLLMEVGLSARRRVVEIIAKVLAYIEEERQKLAELIEEVSDYIRELKGYEDELVDFDYDSLVPNGLTLLDDGDLERYYWELRPKAEESPVSDEVLAETILMRLTDRKGKIRSYRGLVKTEIAPALLQISAERFSSIDTLDVLTVLEGKFIKDTIEGHDESELKTQIESRIREASGFLKINSVDKTRHNQDLTIRCIAVKGGESSKLADWLSAVTDGRKWNLVDNFSDTEILFYTSEYAYPLYTLTVIDELRRAYEFQPEEKRRNIFHLSPKFADFPDVIPFDHTEAWEIFHKAAAIGLVKNGQGSTWVYSCNGNSKELGKSKKEILKFLAGNQTVLRSIQVDIRGHLKAEGQKNVVSQILAFAENLKDDNKGVIDKALLQNIILRLNEGRGW